MKLNPEDLDVVSFATDPNAELAQAYLGGAALIGPYNPMDPTPASRCFVCD
ncbi:MAG TPA: hypothetical protein VE871_05235 [Longimicrobium sp.]|jgi:hypothetical protein|nr:hypothetical protein [Longimicrobium sp.]